MLNQEQLAFLAEILPCWKAMDREHQRLLERTMTCLLYTSRREADSSGGQGRRGYFSWLCGNSGGGHPRGGRRASGGVESCS